MSGNGVIVPKSFPFSSLKRRLKRYQIYWVPRKGKGGHGGFVGPDRNGNKQSFPLPSSQHKEVHRIYLKGLCRRFQLGVKQLFGQDRR
ncbi:hypothetical protein ES705_48812 [subsurface metagenome]